MTVRLNPALTRLRASPTLAVNERIRALRAKGEDVIHFGFGQSPFPVPPEMVEAMVAHAGDKDYLPAAGLPALREAAAAHFSPLLKRTVTPDQVLVGPGSKTLLFHVLFCHQGPLLLPSGSWVSYGPQSALLDKPCHILPARPENQFKITPEDLAECLSDIGPGHQSLLLLNTPNNPTGAVYSRPELEALAEVIQRHDALILSDEIYGQVTFDGVYRSPSHILPERTMVSSGLSKAFSAGGYRLGLLILPPSMENLRGPLVNLATETYSAVTCGVQHAAVAAYRGSEQVEAHVRDCTAIHALVLEYVARTLGEGGVPSGQAQGAFYLFPDFSGPCRSRGIQDSGELARRLLEEQRVASLPGTAFFAAPELLHVRISPLDYDGSRALEVFRRMRSEGEVSPIRFLEEAAPRILQGTARLLALGDPP